MKCYCYETENKFIYCVQDATEKVYENLQDEPYWTKTDDGKFIKVYPTDTGWDDAWYLNPVYKAIVVNNFAKLGQVWLEGIFDWKNVLLGIAKKFAENKIEWYITGSVSEAVLGVDINPHDIDIVVHTRDFYKVKELYLEYAIEPLGDNKGNWIIRYFGKLCIDNASVDIAADDKMNMENRRYPCEKILWNGYDIYIEPLQARYETEIQRNRKDRIKAIEKYMKTK